MQSNKKFISVIAFTLVASLIFIAASIIHLPLPEEEKGNHKVSGAIGTCEVFTVGRSSENNYGIHLTLKNQGVERTFSYNFKGERISYFNSLCSNKPVVNFSYSSNRIILHPQIAYWLLAEPEIVSP